MLLKLRINFQLKIISEDENRIFFYQAPVWRWLLDARRHIYELQSLRGVAALSWLSH